jgi:hypothetical protein
VSRGEQTRAGQSGTWFGARNWGMTPCRVSARLRVNPGAGSVLGFASMELNQIKRFIKDLEERTDSLRRYL